MVTTRGAGKKQTVLENLIESQSENLDDRESTVLGSLHSESQVSDNALDSDVESLSVSTDSDGDGNVGNNGVKLKLQKSRKRRKLHFADSDNYEKVPSQDVLKDSTMT